MAYIEKISFRRQIKDHFPTNETIQVFVLCVSQGVCFKRHVDKKKETRRRKCCVWPQPKNPSISRAAVSSGPCGPSCVFTTRPATRAKLSMALRQGFRNSPHKEEGNKRSGKLIINDLLYGVYLREEPKHTPVHTPKVKTKN